MEHFLFKSNVQHLCSKIKGLVLPVDHQHNVTIKKGNVTIKNSDIFVSRTSLTNKKQ